MKLLKIDITDEVLSAVNNFTLDSLSNVDSLIDFSIMLHPVVSSYFIDKCSVCLFFSVKNISQIQNIRLFQSEIQTITGSLIHKYSGHVIDFHVDDKLISKNIESKMYNIFKNEEKISDN